MSNDKKQRNIDLWNDRQNGMTYKQLGIKYHITSVRCRQICLKMEWKREVNR